MGMTKLLVSDRIRHNLAVSLLPDQIVFTGMSLSKYEWRTMIMTAHMAYVPLGIHAQCALNSRGNRDKYYLHISLERRSTRR